MHLQPHVGQYTTIIRDINRNENARLEVLNLPSPTEQDKTLAEAVAPQTFILFGWRGQKYLGRTRLQDGVRLLFFYADDKVNVAAALYAGTPALWFISAFIGRACGQT